MMYFDGEKVKLDYEAQFKVPFKDITIGQMWWLIKFAKHVRGRCRSNTALHNYLARNFPQFKFSVHPANTKDGRVYDKLSIGKDGHEQVMEEEGDVG